METVKEYLPSASLPPHTGKTALDRKHMHVQEHGQKVEQCRYQGHPDNIAVRRFGEFRHNECTRPHNRRHDLSARGRCRFDTCRFLGFVPQFFHHGNGERAGCHRIGNGTAGDGAHGG